MRRQFVPEERAKKIFHIANKATMHCQILLKFGGLESCGSLESTGLWKSTSGQMQEKSKMTDGALKSDVLAII